MPDYKTGTYIITARKTWGCEICHKDIIPGEPAFARIEEYGEKKFRSDGITVYREKTYKRFHLYCANKLNDLNPHEIALLGNLHSIYPLKVKGNELKPDKIILKNVEDVLNQAKKLGYKVAYMDSGLILLRKTGSDLDTP